MGRKKKIDVMNYDLDTIQKAAEKGLTDKQIAKLLNITEQTLNNYKKQYPLFFESLKKGKILCDKNVEISLYQRATGYSYLDVDIKLYQGKIIKTPIIRHVPPDPTSMIFWLKNRQPDKWRDKSEQDINHKVNVVINYKKE